MTQSAVEQASESGVKYRVKINRDTEKLWDKVFFLIIYIGL